MQKNLANWDRLLRIFIGAAIIVIALYHQSWWALLGLALILNGVTGRCGGYALFGFSTAKSCDTHAGTNKPE
ncbi:DUF2892 domain-containing protein [Methylophaga sp. OBS1]|jgi:hypothetical protein|uniref:YgaP family membrane protein n=1 Tax=Methylophaga sp. OBS1 TaxID=2991933 RepID=UPI00225A4DB9|nr:DUF2892 domain-containing protein [Methylophaga sp. OBS1]MCX4191116.1 DUF2892 domain-containing protein [Methylophaga sp. OBS1]MCX4191938.1 DUF2892 domain-containing protein [Methylophaga sp. OBS1]